MVSVSRSFSSTPEQVYDAWLNPRIVEKFLFATPEGKIVHVEIDANLGGEWVVVDRRNGEDVEHRGEYLELERPQRLVFALAVPKYSKDEVSVFIHIESQSPGCKLTLSQEVPANMADKKDMMASGWQGILEGLALALGEMPTATPIS
ncbi:hypothetical protein BH09SUM1_BH09SUM1_04630 [soil metagenome]